MSTINQNGINFNNINVGEKVFSTGGKYSHVDNTWDGVYDPADIYMSVNAVEIDWQGATLSHVNQPNVLDASNQVNTTGQLLALINDLQNQINALAYIVTNGATSK